MDIGNDELLDLSYKALELNRDLYDTVEKAENTNVYLDYVEQQVLYTAVKTVLATQAHIIKLHIENNLEVEEELNKFDLLVERIKKIAKKTQALW